MVWLLLMFLLQSKFTVYFKERKIGKKPIIIAITPAARNYISHSLLKGMISGAQELHESVQFSVHLDHGNAGHCLSAIESGFYNSVMIDASHESFEKNIAITQDIVKQAHDNEVSVEAELGVLSGEEDDIHVSDNLAEYTNPDDVIEFVERTRCDSLAVAVGTSHGAYKLSGERRLQLNILEDIQKRLPGFPIVLHGASNVPSAEVDRINIAGGELKSNAKGVNQEELIRAIKFGVTKINIATDLRLIWTRVHREFFKGTPELFDPAIPGKKYIEEIKEFVHKKCQSLIIE